MYARAVRFVGRGGWYDPAAINLKQNIIYYIVILLLLLLLLLFLFGIPVVRNHVYHVEVGTRIIIRSHARRGPLCDEPVEFVNGGTRPALVVSPPAPPPLAHHHHRHHILYTSPINLFKSRAFRLNPSCVTRTTHTPI